jgi:hypothetical protein
VLQRQVGVRQVSGEAGAPDDCRDVGIGEVERCDGRRVHVATALVVLLGWHIDAVRRDIGVDQGAGSRPELVTRRDVGRHRLVEPELAV